MSLPILQAEMVSLRYGRSHQRALNEVSVSVVKGHTLGVVGESGSGKSSLARCLLGLEKLEAGRVLFHGQDIAGFSRQQWSDFRRRVQMVFQDPLNSLNPRMTIGQILGEVLVVHRLAERGDVARQVNSLLDQVGLSSAVAGRYPHELSGGQRQRVGISRAISMKPELVIADEPVSALDVSVQAQIMNVLKQLVAERGISLLMIAHDLAVVRYVCRDLIVMKDGVIVEQGGATEVIAAPQHAYTQTLLAAVPDIDALL